VTADAMVITEPLWTHLVVGHPGILYFRIQVPGRSTHAAIAQQGVNAIYEALPLIEALRDLDRERGDRLHLELFERLPGTAGRSVNLNLGTLRAGDWPSTVPGEANLECRLSYLPGEQEDEIKNLVEQTLAQAATSSWSKEHPPRVEWFGWRARPWLQDQDHAWPRLVRQAVAAERGVEPDFAADTAGLDARFAGEFEVPCVVYGPDGDNIHGVDEWVSLASIRSVARTLVRAVIDWCG